jgi:hypothetical protein
MKSDPSRSFAVLYNAEVERRKTLEGQLEEIYAGLRQKGWEEVHQYQATPSYLELALRPSDQPTKWWHNRDLQRQLADRDLQDEKIKSLRQFAQEIRAGSVLVRRAFISDQILRILDNK